MERRHQMHSGHARNILELLHEFETDALAFSALIRSALESPDQRIRDDRAVEAIPDPMRRACGGQGRKANEQVGALRDAVFHQTREVASHDSGVHAELGLDELRAGIELALQVRGPPVRGRIDR
jgi:hypothetical protein